MSKIQQLLNYQQYHDSTYHPDIYSKDIIDKLKHFCLHLTKYYTRLISNQSLSIQDSNKYWIDTTLISLSMANTLNILIPDVNIKDGIEYDIPYYKLVTKNYGDILYTICKSLDAYDHIENYNVRLSLETAVKDMFILIQHFVFITDNKDFEQLLSNRYSEIREKCLS